MTHSAYAYALRERPFEDTPAKPRRNRSFTIPLIELVRPDSFWPQPLSIERAFELMRWMVDVGGSKYDTPQRWGTCSVSDLLGATSGIGHTSMLPIKSLDDLRRRFHYAILARPSSEGQERWREDNGIGPAGVIKVIRPTYRPFDGASHLCWRSEGDIQDALAAMLTGSTGKRMAVSLNSVHKDSVNWLHCVDIEICRNSGFWFNITYGCDPAERGASRWSEVIAQSRDGESFLDTMARARDVFDLLVHGKVNDADVADLLEHQYIGADFIRDQIAALGQEAPACP